MRINVIKSNQLILIIVTSLLVIFLTGCFNNSQEIDAKEVKSIKLKFIPGRGTDQTLTQKKDTKEIDEFINAYNKTQPYRNDHETTHPVIAYINLVNGQEIIIRGGTQGFQTITKDGNQYNISGKELNNYFISLLAEAAPAIPLNKKYTSIAKSKVKLGRLFLNRQEQILTSKQITKILDLMNNSKIYFDSDINSINLNGYDIALDLNDGTFIFLNNIADQNYVLVNRDKSRDLLYNPSLNKYIKEIRKIPDIKFDSISLIKVTQKGDEKIIADKERLNKLALQSNKSVSILGTKCPFGNRFTIKTNDKDIPIILASDGCNVLKIDDYYFLLTSKGFNLLEEILFEGK